jgi:hypothetical protein
MDHRDSTTVVTAFLLACAVSASCARRDATPDPKVAPPVESGPAVTKAVATNTTSLDALAPPEPDDGTKARRSIAMTESRGTVDPTSSSLRALPAHTDAPSSTGADNAVKAMPTNVPVGSLTKSQLEAPLRDRARFDHCAIPYGTHGEIAAVVYNGAASSVEVKTTPNDRALNFCIERAVRQMTWVKELAVNKVKVTF